jgi:hypothetical protein
MPLPAAGLDLAGKVGDERCCGEAGGEVEGSPLRFYIAPLDPDQHAGWLAVLGKDERPVLFGQEDSNPGQYVQELWRGTGPATRADGWAAFTLPADVLPRGSLKLWSGSQTQVRVSQRDLPYSESGETIAFVRLEPAGLAGAATPPPAPEAPRGPSGP